MTFGAVLAVGILVLNAAAWDPEPPVAGTTFVIELPEPLLAAGRELVLSDPIRDRVVGRARIGRYPRSLHTFVLPVDLLGLVIEYHEGTRLLARWPREGHLEPVEADPEAGLGLRDDCPALPPDAGREALDRWVLECPLEHAPLVGRDLSGIDLTERSLARADLRGANLSDARLGRVDLSGASLAGARLDGANLAGSRLALADLSAASLFVADLDGADLRGADLRDADLSAASFSNADLTGARLAGARLDDTDFSGALCPDGTLAARHCSEHLELP